MKKVKSKKIALSAAFVKLFGKSATLKMNCRVNNYINKIINTPLTDPKVSSNPYSITLI